MNSSIRCSIATIVLLFSVYLQCFVGTINGYIIPDPTFEILKPKGLRVSIPDATGVQFFGFHGNINKGIISTELGDIYGDVYRPENGRWIIEDTTANLRDGDEINYWIYVQRLNSSFRKDNQRWTISLRSTNGNEPTPTTMKNETFSNRQGSEGNLLFEDNFNSLNAAYWHREVKIPLAPDYEFCAYHNENHEQLVTVNDGILKIQPLILEDYYGENATAYGKIQLNPCTSNIPAECTRQATSYNIIPPVISARLTTKESFSFRYGKVEIRAKFPEGDWLYPEMWLQSKYYSYPSSNLKGRVLLGLARGNEDLTNITTMNIYDSRKLDFGVRIGWTTNMREILVSKTQQRGIRWTHEFHTYTTIWNENGFKFFVDGEEVGRLNPEPGGWLNDNKYTENAPFDQEYIFSIGVGVGGIRVFPDDTISGQFPKPWRNVSPMGMLNFWRARNTWLPSWRRHNGRNTAFEIDYIRVYSA